MFWIVVLCGVLIYLCAASHKDRAKIESTAEKKKYRKAFVQRLFQEAKQMPLQQRAQMNWAAYVNDARDALPEDTPAEETIKHLYLPWDEQNEIYRQLMALLDKHGMGRSEREQCRFSFLDRLCREAEQMPLPQRVHTDWPAYLEAAWQALPERTPEQWTAKYRYLRRREHRKLYGELRTMLYQRRLLPLPRSSSRPPQC